jgi:hypothetical protein
VLGDWDLPRFQTPQPGRAPLGMRLSHTLGRTSVALYDPTLVLAAGLVPVLGPGGVRWVAGFGR